MTTLKVWNYNSNTRQEIPKTITIDKQYHLIMINGSILQEDITILNIQ